MTNSFFTDDEIEPFKHRFEDKDLLGRADFGQKLTALVDRIEEPMVIVLEGEWGSGKSFFLKLWTHSHTVDFSGSSRVIYLDAFRHDYLDDPFISLVGAITEGQSDKEASKGAVGNAVSKIKTTAAKLALPAMRVGLAVGTAGVSEAAGALAQAAASAAGNEAANAVETLWQREASRQRAFDDFRAALVELTAADDKPRNLVIIVDELDRCRPDYALQVLEVAKHFFTVPRVHFVLGCNMTALEASVAHRYGDSLNAARYLQKFVSLRARLPEPQEETANVQYLHALNKTGRLPREVHEDLTHFLNLAALRDKVSLRDLHRILHRLHYTPIDLGRHYWPFRNILLAAIFLEVLDSSLYRSFRAHAVAADDLHEFFGCPMPNLEKITGGFMNSLAFVIHGYLHPEPDSRVVEVLKESTRQAFFGAPATEFQRFLKDTLDSFTIIEPAIEEQKGLLSGIVN